MESHVKESSFVFPKTISSAASSNVRTTGSSANHVWLSTSQTILASERRCPQSERNPSPCAESTSSTESRKRDFTIDCRLTEGFYDTASHRSQQASQLPTVYKKETTLPKRRNPRRGKTNHGTKAADAVNQTMLQR